MTRRTILEKDGRIGRAASFFLGVIQHPIRKGHPEPAPTEFNGDSRSNSRGPAPRRLVLLLVVSALASLAVTASASAGTLFTNPTLIKILASGAGGPAALYPSEIAVSGRQSGDGVDLHHQQQIVDGRIVAEVFVGLLQADRDSCAKKDPGWKPPQGQDQDFEMADLFGFACVA